MEFTAQTQPQSLKIPSLLKCLAINWNIPVQKIRKFKVYLFFTGSLIENDEKL